MPGKADRDFGRQRSECPGYPIAKGRTALKSIFDVKCREIIKRMVISLCFFEKSCNEMTGHSSNR